MPYSSLLYMFGKFQNQCFLKIGPGSLPLLFMPTSETLPDRVEAGRPMRMLLQRPHSNQFESLVILEDT